MEGTAPRVTARRPAPGNPLSLSTLKAPRAIHRRRGFRLEGALPALDRLMIAAKRWAFDAVVVFRFDRFARSVSHLARAPHEFRALGIEFVSLHEAVVCL